ncbi:hypothetical protein EJ04DRAFT_579459 [Polyplosphaeria fusca]|uniref:Uncharacterized protein n=1 Tax=Polyplosphaeria fusca TaxID=682080 RepID=A0A9P4QTU0_9PLEO|nr:hypothetical protein EJ04DRAFT_579459 [Polyplosphaeria fusca]
MYSSYYTQSPYVPPQASQQCYQSTTSQFTAGLAPLPPPGLVIFPNYTAQRPESIIIKEKHKHITRQNFVVSYASTSHNFLELDEDSKGNMLFIDLQTRQEVMRIVKQGGGLLGGGDKVYKGVGLDGREKWTLQLKRHSFSGSGSEYLLTANIHGGQATPLQVQNRVSGAEKAILWNGRMVATMNKHQELQHLRRQDRVDVAPGMDILLALGVAWIRIVKQKKDERKAIDALAGM